MHTRTPTAKIVIVGDISVGKSSLTLRYVFDQFSKCQESTFGASYLQKVQNYTYGGKSGQIMLQIWDTAGQEKYRSITRMYFRDCKVAILVYDISRKQTFVELKKWAQEIEKNAPKDIQLFVVGNKMDLLDMSSFRSENETHDMSIIANFAIEEEGIGFAKKINACYFAVSAKSGKGINELFNCIAQKVGLKGQQKNQQKKFLNKHASSVLITKSIKTKKDKNNCCRQ